MPPVSSDSVDASPSGRHHPSSCTPTSNGSDAAARGEDQAGTIQETIPPRSDDCTSRTPAGGAPSSPEGGRPSSAAADADAYQDSPGLLGLGQRTPQTPATDRHVMHRPEDGSAENEREEGGMTPQSQRGSSSFEDTPSRLVRQFEARQRARALVGENGSIGVGGGGRADMKSGDGDAALESSSDFNRDEMPSQHLGQGTPSEEESGGGGMTTPRTPRSALEAAVRGGRGPISGRREEGEDEADILPLFRSPSSKAKRRGVDEGANEQAPRVDSDRDEDVNDRTDGGSSSQEEQSEHQQEPLLSILNLVVDHVMVPPTPLEPEEFNYMLSQRPQSEKDNNAASEKDGAKTADAPSQQHESEMLPSTPPPPPETILVPVLRFFGPVLRGSSKSGSVPRQSGCLHVHGAYPYMLARPIVAGPDGSSCRRSGASVNNDDVDASLPLHGGASFSVDWDDVASVSLIVDEVHAKLEGALRASAMWRANRDSLDGAPNACSKGGTGTGTPGKPSEVNQKQQQEQPQTRFIRQITVVTGRGFYTYCPGPPAPFLRVEYYDPRMRWRVKLMLERGLDVTAGCHPDSRWYDSGGLGEGGAGGCGDRAPPRDNADSDERIKPLRFRCYEAHIPYTMQFFKDCNLSGMSYIKVCDGRFRRSIPKKGRVRILGKGSVAAVDAHRSIIDNTALFLECTVPKGKVWAASNELSVGVIGDPSPCGAESHSEGVAKSSFPIYQEEQFWTKNETSCDVELDTTVHQLMNVKDVMTSLPDDPSERERIHWRAVPSLREIWELERRRMSTLLPPKDDFLSHPNLPKTGEGEGKGDGTPESDDASVTKTPPFTLSVKKGASVPGARLAVRGMMKLYDASPGLEEDYRRALGDIVKRHERFIGNVDEAFHDRHGDQGAGRDPAAPVALRTSPVDLSSPALPDNEALEALNALGGQFAESPIMSQMSASTQSRPSLGENASSDHAMLHRPASQAAPLTQADMEEVHEAVEFGRSVDRGDAVVGPGVLGSMHNPIDDMIDPLTLTPYAGCDEDGGFLNEEEELGEEGLVRSLSILATQSNTARSKTRDGSDDAKEATALNLDFIQEESEGLHSFQYGVTDENQQGGDSSDGSDADLDDAKESLNIYQESAEERTSDEILASESCGIALSDSKVLIRGDKPPSELDLSLVGKASESQHLKVSRGDVLTLRRKAPLRSDCCSSGGGGCHLNPLIQSEKEPPWLRLSTKYNALRSPFVGANVTVCIDGSNEDRNVFVEPVKRPPSSSQLSSWIRRRRKRKALELANLATDRSQRSTCKRPRSSNSGAKPCQDTKREGGDLVIDGNSRQLVAAPPSSKRKKKRVGFADDVMESSCQVFAVEEVEWDGSCECKSQQSQSSQSPFQNSPLSLSEEGLSETKNELSQGSSDLGEGQNDIPGDEGGGGCIESSPPPKETDSKRKAENTTGSQIGTTFRSSTQGAYTANGPSASCTISYTAAEESQQSVDPLEGIGQQGGKIHVAGGGGLKVTEAAADAGPSLSTSPSPLTIISIEVHVQCRTGKAGVNDSKVIAMKPDSARDAVSAVTYIYARDPGGGEEIELLERGCVFIPVEAELASQVSSDANSDANGTPPDASEIAKRSNKTDLMRRTLGMGSKATMELVRSERQLLLRLSSIIQWKDPDALLSWDTQGGGLGYLIERGSVLGKESDGRDNGGGKAVDVARLLGRTPKSGRSVGSGRSLGSGSSSEPLGDDGNSKQQNNQTNDWTGSGLGAEWDDRVGAGAASSSIVGRLVFCAWKIIAEEVKHPNASYLPAMVSTILRKRIPYHDDLILTKWYGADRGRFRWRVLEHRLAQATATLLLFDALDIIGRAGEAARLSGVEFSQSLPGIRGSQYKVEGVLLRALQSVWSDERGEREGINKVKTTPVESGAGSKPSSSLSNDSLSQTASPWKLRRNASQGHQNQGSGTEAEECNRGYFFFSPSKDDCGNQEALECQALTLEPQSGFHSDPIVVCDFTALYPSLIIAYNLCYSSCAGKLEYHSTRREMNCKGRTSNKLGPFHYAEGRSAAVLKHHMKSLDGSKDARKDRAYVVPTGSLFVSETVVKGVLPQVLDELLSTRAMLKKAAKAYRHLPNVSPAILRSLEAKQLALKYVANVTYGYTSATFSGRSAMPVLADAIVECGRRTLTNAIQLANDWGKDENGRWSGAHVVYGDTDSVFVKLPGRSVKEAFAFGEHFCKAVTASNPPPVQLKLEKVYVKSLLQTKKKYCGMKYESPHEKRPVFEAKGIETVRRDQCALTQKVLRNVLVTLFQGGVDAVKAYLCRQWALIHAGRLPVSDFILTGRVRSRYRGGKIGPVQAALARRLAEADPGRTVRHKERIPYVIVAAPGLNFKLRDCVLTPTELMEQWDCYTVHAAYYTKKHVNAALQRCLGLPPYKIDVNAWYEASFKPRRRIHHWPVTRTGGNAMITAHFGSDNCALCGVKCKAKGSSRAAVCPSCSENKVYAAFLATMRLNKAEQEANAIAAICERCNNCPESSSTFAPEKPIAQKKDRASNVGNNIILRVSKGGKGGSSGIITPIANCVCIDCPITYERHKLRETQIEAEAVCKALDLF